MFLREKNCYAVIRKPKYVGKMFKTEGKEIKIEPTVLQLLKCKKAKLC